MTKYPVVRGLRENQSDRLWERLPAAIRESWIQNLSRQDAAPTQKNAKSRNGLRLSEIMTTNTHKSQEHT